MNKKPVVYMQTDPRWKDKPYQVKGETATIGGRLWPQLRRHAH